VLDSLAQRPGLLQVLGAAALSRRPDGAKYCALRSSANTVAASGRGRSKYVRTDEYVAEQTAKRCLFRGMMGTMPPPGDGASYKFKNPSNTNVFYWGGKLLAVWESGLPYALNPRTLETEGKETLGGVLKPARCLAAHYRIDTARNRLITFRYCRALPSFQAMHLCVRS
jgi:carotenoid cleavage dioxygenase-like enzyme